MTYEELVKQTAAHLKLTSKDGRPAHGLVRDVLRFALKTAAEAAKTPAGAPLFPTIGRFKMVRVRSSGRTASGQTWQKPGRTKLTLRASKHQGGRGKSTPAQSFAANPLF